VFSLNTLFISSTVCVKENAEEQSIGRFQNSQDWQLMKKGLQMSPAYAPLKVAKE
jgi:hypothetical protein